MADGVEVCAWRVMEDECAYLDAVSEGLRYQMGDQVVCEVPGVSRGWEDERGYKLTTVLRLLRLE